MVRVFGHHISLRAVLFAIVEIAAFITFFNISRALALYLVEGNYQGEIIGQTFLLPLFCVIAFATMGFENWRKAFMWQLGGTLARTSGLSGWSRSYPSPYRLLVKSDKSASTAVSWHEAWRLTSARANWQESNDFADGDPMSGMFARGALVLGVRLGVKEAEEPLQWLTAQLRRRQAVVPYKWRLTAA